MWSLHHALLLLCSPAVLGFYSYPSSYSGEEEYEYDGEESEEGEEVEELADYVPVFLTSPHTTYVHEGGRATLECRVDRLGPMVMSWSRVRGANTSYIATGGVLMVGDRRMSVERGSSSSTLYITGVEEGDQGEYMCSVSSQPPVHIKLELRIQAPPSATILGRPSSGQLLLRQGGELALVCQAGGSPLPSPSWSRQGGTLPDGRASLHADQIIYSRVTVDHSGTYTCTAGQANQSVQVRVLHPPLVTLDQSYQHSRGGALLELVCTVQADPPARVEWWRSGLSLAGLGEVGGRAKVEYRREGRHVLTLDSPQQADLGTYSCSANNTEGQARAHTTVSGPGSPDSPDSPSKSSPLRMGGGALEHREQEERGSTMVVGGGALEHREQEEENHRILKHILHRVNKFDQLHKDIVTAMKESNRFLAQLLRDQKKLLATKNGGGTL